MWGAQGSGRRAALADALLAVVLAVAALVESTQPGRGYRVPAVMVPATLLVTLALAVRRRAPLAVLLVGSVVESALALLSSRPASAVLFLALLVALYTLVVHSSHRTTLCGLAMAVVAATVSEVRDPATHSVVEAVPTYVVMAAVGVLAQVVRRSREQALRMQGLAADLAASRAEAEQGAALAERLRIAREMHDVLAHSVSVMVLQAGAARISLQDQQPAARELLGQVEDVGRRALVELREILGLLRTPGEASPAELAPPSGDLPGLVRTMRETGLPLVVHGGEQVALLTPPLALTVFRVVQEAVTNAAKHGGRTATRVDIEVSAHAVVVEVLDAGPSPTPAALPAGGHGLAGLHERVGVHEGTLEAGPAPGGGWRVRAVLPRVPHAAPTGGALR